MDNHMNSRSQNIDGLGPRMICWVHSWVHLVPAESSTSWTLHSMLHIMNTLYNTVHKYLSCLNAYVYYNMYIWSVHICLCLSCISLKRSVCGAQQCLPVSALWDPGRIGRAGNIPKDHKGLETWRNMESWYTLCNPTSRNGWLPRVQTHVYGYVWIRIELDN